MNYVRCCPSCKSNRPVSEMYCQNIVGDTHCGWLLMNVPQTPAGGKIEIPQEVEEPTQLFCINGHAVGIDDFMCMECGADIEEASDTAQEEIIERIQEYTVLKSIKTTRVSKECFLVEDANEEQFFLTLYHENCEPDKAIYNVLRNSDIDHLAILAETGYWNNRFFEVSERIQGGSLDSLVYIDESKIDTLVDEIGRALHDFSEVGFRHRDLCPKNILIRDIESFDLVIIDYSSARLSDYDLDTDTPLELTRYTAPEAIIGGVSPASDWWSLGMIVLEQVTKGAFFEDINDKAFMIHLVTRGVQIPEGIDERISLLLKGLLCRDPLRRWNWEQVKKWLDGEYIAPPEETIISADRKKQKSISLAGESFTNASYFALAAAEEKNWDEGLALFTSGEISIWAEEILQDDVTAAAIRNLRSKEDIDLEWCFSLALMHLNKALPLTWRGQLVIPAWLLGNPTMAFEIIRGSIPDYLDSISREKWLVQLKTRKQNIIQRANNLGITLNEDKFRINALGTSRVRLKSELNLLRLLYPDAKNISLSDLMGDIRLGEEDLILILSAQHDQFIPLVVLVEDIIKEATKIKIEPNEDFYRELLIKPRVEIHELLHEHLEGFSQSGNFSLDRWADRFRVERRLSLSRSILCLSIPKNQWVTPPKHQYASSLLRFFERKIIHASSRGPLVRLIISKHSARLDIGELGTPLKSPKRLLDNIINRSSNTEKVDPLSFSKNPLLTYRTRRMLLQTANFKRDTGLDSLYLGFPFLINQVKKTNRPRILPIILWPVHLEFRNRSRPSLELSFDKTREEIRLNPALSSALEPEEYKKINQIYQEILSRQSLSVSEVMDAFGSHIESNSNNIVAHPQVTYMMNNPGLELHGSAVIFNANFTGQSISEDLRLLQRLPHSGTAMEPLLKISSPEISKYRSQTNSESESFTVIEVDPSQEKAVMQGRQNPGIVIEGPPGTGKSQTIVNIISDCIGRNEKVLVVSQKRAAIQVITKRLEAVGLEKRALSITDTTKDRQEIIRSIREQVSTDLKESEQQEALQEILIKRDNLAKWIDRLESELNVLSEQIHVLDEKAGTSYRNILSELIEIQSEDYIEAPEARGILEDNSADDLNVLETQISSLINYWMPSKYEGSTLKHLKSTHFDDVTKTTIERDLTDLINVETKRIDCIAKTTGLYDGDQAQFYKAWLQTNEQKLLKATDSETKNARKWFDLIYDEFNEKSIAEDILENLKQLLHSVKTLASTYRTTSLSDWLIQIEDKSLQKIIRACDNYFKKSAFKAINPFSWAHNYRLKKALKQFNLEVGDTNVNHLKTNSEYESTFRKYRKEFNSQLNKLNTSAEKISETKFLGVKIGAINDALLDVITLANALKSCPLKKEARNVLKSGETIEFQNFVKELNDASLRFEKRQESQKKLAVFRQWLTSSSHETFLESILNNAIDISILEKMQLDMMHFIPYQKFRIRLGEIAQNDKTLQLFAIFRKYEDQIAEFSAEHWSELIRNTTRREGLLGWKQRIEKKAPALLMADNEIDQKVKSLGRYLDQIKGINKKLLNLNYDFQKISSKSEWHGITRLRGRNYKKLREFIHLGDDRGLMDIRPIWLMSPEVVSQALPLQAGMFDVVIFDEASQMLIDHAIPSLYRAKRVIVSGDEKQMPPTGFFGHKIDDDSEDVTIELTEDNSEEELAMYEEAWNKKEVKDCPDLLTLAKTVLPTTTLQIHYRSRYKALINFSNHAFYNGQLHVPVFHPLGEIEKTKPLEVIRVDGTYNEQTNEAEADALIEYLSNYWKLPQNGGFSTGIVTFNKKQSDLIEEKIEEKAINDESFRTILNREREKQQDREAMGFFVKNVENVQGDERDMILFSTTFGFNQHGIFRRNFGALGHRGGERRLNVAITRARHKVVIATSMPINDISDMLSTGRLPSKPRDYIQGYLNYTETHSNKQIEIANTTIKRLSLRNSNENLSLKNDGFKNTVRNYIHSLGYKTVEDSDDNVFYLDLAIVDKETGSFVIGIECDVPNNPLLQNARYRELWRPLVLKKSIPFIHRTTSYKWLQHTDSEKMRLKNAIENALNLTA